MPLIFKVVLLPAVRVTDFLLMDGVCTVILQVYFCLPTLAVITAVPFLRAVTLPLAFTVAIPDFEEDHFTLDFAPDIFKLSVCPLISVAFVLLSLAFVAASTLAVFCGPGKNSEVEKTSDRMISSENTIFLVFFITLRPFFENNECFGVMIILSYACRKSKYWCKTPGINVIIK